MELVIGVTIRQLLLHLNCASEFEAPGDAGVSANESLVAMPNDKLRARLWLVGYQVLLRFQITDAEDVSVRIRANIRQIGKQVPLVVIGAESTLFLLHGVHLKTNSQICGYAYSNINY